MSKAKIFRVTGQINKPNLKTSFEKELRALKPEEAVEKVYTEIGSKHRAKRFEIKVLNVEEISFDQVKDPSLKKYLQDAKQSGE